MNGCSYWEDAIRDYALGKTPQPNLSAHLAICPRCQNHLRSSQAMAARIDAALHRSAAVPLPPYGPERVMGRIDKQTDTRAWRRWAVVLSAVAAVLLAVLLWVRRPVPQADVTALSTWRSPTEALLRPPVAAAWTIRPRLGEGFFKLKASGERHAQ
jgi:anti-sigma factor RsiW